jgi:hypothetical protein
VVYSYAPGRSGEHAVTLLGDVAYVWHGSTHVSEVQDSLRDAGFMVRAHLIWATEAFGDRRWARHVAEHKRS